MEKRKSIPLIIIAVFSIVILLANGNLEKVYAITLRSNEPDGTMETPTVFGYNSNFDYLLTGELQGGVIHVHVVNGDDLTLASDITTTLTSLGGVGVSYIPCSATLCFITGQIGSNPAIIRINMVTLTISATYSESEYGSCIIGEPELFGTSIYVLISDFGSCPYSGIYSIPTGFTADVGAGNIQWIQYDSSTSFGNLTGETCIVDNGSFFIHVDFNNQVVRKYNLSTKTISSSASLGALITHAHCDTSSTNGYVYATSINGDWVKRVSLSSLAIDGTTISLTNPQYVFQRGDSIYASRDDATTVTSISKANWGTGTFVLFSSLAHNDVAFFKGNSTRFNMVAPTTNDNIFYAVDGVLDEEEEEGQPSETACFDINDSPETVQLVCYEDEDGDGFPDLAGGVFGGLSPTRNITSSAQFLAENLGLVEEGSDIRFNGVGYMIVGVGLGILIAMFFLASGGDLNRIPTFVWFIGTLAMLGALTGFGFVDVTFFIIGILVIIALASAKILSTLELGGFK